MSLHGFASCTNTYVKEWMPTPEQVAQKLPHVFKEKYPNTFAMDLKFSLRPLVISRCSHLHGEITTLRSF